MNNYCDGIILLFCGIETRFFPLIPDLVVEILA